MKTPPPTFNDAEIQNTYSVNYWKKTYTNYLIIPTLDFTLLHMGDLNDFNTIEGNTMLFIISAVIIILLMLIILFFSSVTSLSLRILDFSSFIQHSDTNNLTSYQLTNRDMSNFDELTLLIKTYNEMITENNALISKVQKMELLSQNARFQALQAQIHPHFIYGTLETIRMTALQNKDKEAASMIFSLSALIRYSISISKSVTLKDEIDIATHYLTIQKIRFSERLEYQFSIDENLLCLQIPAFVLQPILENAIIYGISQTLDACHLFVHVSTSDHTLTLKIGNSGLPISDERLFEVNELLSGAQKIESFHGRQNGLALNNIRERLLIFYHGNASIYMTREENFTNTVITIQDYQNFLEKGTESHVFDSYCR